MLQHVIIEQLRIAQRRVLSLLKIDIDNAVVGNPAFQKMRSVNRGKQKRLSATANTRDDLDSSVKLAFH